MVTSDCRDEIKKFLNKSNRDLFVFFVDSCFRDLNAQTRGLGEEINKRFGPSGKLLRL